MTSLPTTYKKISPLVEGQFPEFLREDGPKFVAFVKAYYEFCEQTGKPGEANRSLLDNQDIDRTVDAFVDHFRKTYMESIPKEVAVDKRLLTKHIRDFYRTRGSEESARFLFRAIFDQEIDFYYPGEDILRASDGRWVKETVVYLNSPWNIAPTSLQGRRITGATSEATGLVQGVVGVTTLGVLVHQCTLENVSGTFLDGERVTDGSGNYATILASQGIITSWMPLDGGAFHLPGDSVTLVGERTGASAIGTVLTVNNTDVSQGLVFRIVDPGRGFSVANTVFSLSGGGGTGARLRVTGISNTSTVSVNKDKINALKNVRLNTGATFVTGGSNSTFVTANLASANISSTLGSKLTFSATTVGSINAISLTDPGYSYTSIPTVDVIDQDIADLMTAASGGGIMGHNAVVVANNATGALVTLSIVSSSAGFQDEEYATVSNNRTGSASVTNSRFGTRVKMPGATSLGGWGSFTRDDTYTANGVVSTAGNLTLPGRYTDTRGFLSWNNRLQDNDYYQEYSYVIRAAQELDRYKEILKKSIHPAGTKMFGDYVVHSTATTPLVVILVKTNFEYVAIAEAVTATDSMSAGILATAAIGPEAASASDSAVVLVAFRPAISESVTATSSEVVVVAFAGSMTETVTADDAVAVQAAFAPAISESVTSIDTDVVTVKFLGALLDGTGYIESWQGTEVDAYDDVTLAAFLAGVLTLEDTIGATIT